MYSFKPRWKEELVCETPHADFVIEITMGELHVYFPTQERWLSLVPECLHSEYNQIIQELENWCRKQNIPFTCDFQAWVNIEKLKT